MNSQKFSTLFAWMKIFQQRLWILSVNLVLLFFCFVIGWQRSVTAHWCPICRHRPSGAPPSCPAVTRRASPNSTGETVRKSFCCWRVTEWIVDFDERNLNILIWSEMYSLSWPIMNDIVYVAWQGWILQAWVLKPVNELASLHFLSSWSQRVFWLDF